VGRDRPVKEWDVGAFAKLGLTQLDPPTELKRGLYGSPLFKGG